MLHSKTPDPKPKHKRGGAHGTEKAWAWISGTISTLTNTTSRATYFEQDQVAKWFGLHVQEVNIRIWLAYVFSLVKFYLK